MTSRCRSLMKPLHLGHHAEDCQYNVAHLTPRRNMRVEHSHERLPLFALVDQIQHVAGIAAEPVKSCGQKLVARSHELDDRFQLDTACTATTRHLRSMAGQSRLQQAIAHRLGYRLTGHRLELYGVREREAAAAV